MAEFDPGFRHLKTEVIPLTPKLAESFRDMEASPTERALSHSRVQHLRNKVLHGLVMPFYWARARFKDDPKRVVRMNGQHSSVMLCKLNGAFPEDAEVIMSDYEVDGPEGLAMLFRQYDDRKSGRTPADVSGAYQGLYDDLAEVPRRIHKLAVEAYAWHRRMIDCLPAASSDDRYTYTANPEVRAFSVWLNDVLGVKTPELEQRTTIIAAMYATWRANPAQAQEWWPDVARGGDEDDDRSPATVLDEWLVEALKRAKAGKPVGIDSPEFYQGCVYAWNAFRQEKDIEKIRYSITRGYNEVIE